MPRCTGALAFTVLKSHSPYKTAGTVFITDVERWVFHVSLAFGQILDEGKKRECNPRSSFDLSGTFDLDTEEEDGSSLKEQNKVSFKPESSDSHHRHGTPY